MKVEIFNGDTAFIVRLAEAGGGELWTVRFESFEDAVELAQECAEWFPGCALFDLTQPGQSRAEPRARVA